MKRKTALSLAIVMCLGMAVSACSKGGSPAAQSTKSPSASPTGSPSATPKEELKPVELIFYYPIGKQQPDQKAVEDEINKITQAKINATIKFNPIDMGNYTQKMNTVVAASEPADVIWTSNWNFLYEPNVRKGAFLPLDELIDKYAPSLKQTVPPLAWDGTKVDGKIYGVPNMQIMASQGFFSIQKRLVDKYNIDVSKIKKYEDIEPVLDIVKKNEPDMIPIDNWGNGYYVFDNMWEVPSVPGALAFVYKDDKTYKIQPVDFPEIRHKYQLFRDWYQKGYIFKDAATAKRADYLPKGLIAVQLHVTYKPGIEANYKAANGGFDMVSAMVTESTTKGWDNSTDFAISRTSKNPERAMMFLDLIDSDKQLYNLLAKGIEGKHYDKNPDGTIKLKPNSAYNPNQDWVFGTQFNAVVLEGQPLDAWEQTKKLNTEAKVNPFAGFSFNSEPVKTEIANVTAASAEYTKGFETGTLDFDKLWPEYVAKLKAAGQDKIFAEAQKQLDEFLKKKGLK